MHLLRTEQRSLDEAEAAVDLGQTPAGILFLSFSDSDLGLVKRLGTAGYRPLLEGGIRVFEWKGPMLHAKTAVADGLWARVGSTNLNIASWMGNWELDVAVEDAGFAAEMERTYEADLANATEVVADTFQRAWRIAAHFDAAQSSVLGWLTGIAGSLVQDALHARPSPRRSAPHQKDASRSREGR